jgi:hypothetical protein
MKYVFDQIRKEKHGLGLGCSFLDMDFQGETRNGFLCKWKFKCKMCNVISYINSEDVLVNANMSGVNAMLAIGEL